MTITNDIKLTEHKGGRNLFVYKNVEEIMADHYKLYSYYNIYYVL